MMVDYITKIKGKVSIYATKKTSNILDGAYTSIFMGRSMNFEDLREYIPGDNIRDIDWKASSRSRNLLVKRFVAEKKHNVMFVLDSGKKMSGFTGQMHDKSEVALTAMGTIAYLANKNGDNTGAIYSKGEMISLYPFRTGLYNIERILECYHQDSKSPAASKSSITRSLDYVISHIRKRMIIFVITDELGLSQIDEAQLKRLKLQHDILVIKVGDAEVTGGEAYSVETDSYLPEFITGNKKLHEYELKLRKKMKEENDRKLLKYGVSSVEMESDEDVVEKVIELLERHRYANSH
ncbi:MAG: DUF58 domain-containing protein [Clostridia bacterium]|nr:DUF58 domain-containing protein [Clostridia bacterium]